MDFAEAPNFVEKSLYIGNYHTVMDKAILKEYKITHIVSILDIPFNIPYPEDFKYLKINIEDVPYADLLQYFPSAFSFIDNAINENGNVFIHCGAGMSRSATVMISYLMASKKIDYYTAYNIVRKARPIINPNEGFILQLHLWQNMNYQIEGNTPAHKVYRLNKILWSSYPLGWKYYYDNNKLLQSPILEPDPEKLISKGYTCKKCNRKLFLLENILPHSRTFDPNALHSFGGVEVNPENDCNSIFIEPIQWMSELDIIAPKGDLTCPSCKSKIGLWIWDEHECDCGELVSPAFCIIRERVSLND